MIHDPTIPAIDRRKIRMYNPYAKQKTMTMKTAEKDRPRRHDVKVYCPKDVKKKRRHWVRKGIEKPSLVHN